jgi:hypothetical protein
MAESARHNVRAFVSYSHQDRQYGGQAKRVLAEVGIDAFLAHDDLDVSEEWRERILEELRQCGLFVPILSEQFLQSRWTSQEVGFIVSRPDVVVAPLSIDSTTPYGFLSHLQSRRIPPNGITRELLVEPLARKLPRAILPGLIQIAAKAGTFRDAEAKLRPLVPLFALFTAEEAQALGYAAVENGQIWNAALCRTEYLPELLRTQGANLTSETRRALQHQIEHQEWYPGETQETDPS